MDTDPGWHFEQEHRAGLKGLLFVSFTHDSRTHRRPAKKKWKRSWIATLKCQ